MVVDFLYLLDSGGQPAFREMAPHFVQKADAIVLMFKLNEKLTSNQLSDIRDRKRERKIKDTNLK